MIHYDRLHQVFELRSSSRTENLPFHEPKDFGPMYAAFGEALRNGSSNALPTGYDGLFPTCIARDVVQDLIARRGQDHGAAHHPVMHLHSDPFQTGRGRITAPTAQTAASNRRNTAQQRPRQPLKTDGRF